jgi:hypothetical protein
VVVVTNFLGVLIRQFEKLLSCRIKMSDHKILEKLLKLSNILVLGNIIPFGIGSVLAFFPTMMLLNNPKEIGFYGVLFILVCVLVIITI